MLLELLTISFNLNYYVAFLYNRPGNCDAMVYPNSSTSLASSSTNQTIHIFVDAMLFLFHWLLEDERIHLVINF